MARIAIVVVFALAVPAATAWGAAGPADTLRAEVRHLQAGDYAKFYALMSPRFRADCPYAKFKRQGPEQRRQLAGAKLQIVRVHVAGDTATIDYRFVRNGQTLAVTGDRYVRVKGKWLDDVDQYTHC